MNTNKITFSILLLGCFLLFSSADKENWFEGKITYTLKVESHDTSLNMPYIQSIIGTISVFSFKNGNSKEFFPGGKLSEDYFDVKLKKHYFKLKDNDTFFEEGVTKAADSDFKYTIKETSETVAGYPCKEMDISMISLKDHTRRHSVSLFNSGLSMNPDWYSGIEMGFADTEYHAIKSIPLQYSLDLGKFRIIGTAVKVERENLSDDDVHIPKGAIVKPVAD